MNLHLYFIEYFLNKKMSRIFEWILILNILNKNLKYPLEYLQVPPGVRVPPFENHWSKYGIISICYVIVLLVYVMQ